MTVWIYALARAAPPSLPRGLAGEPLRAVAVGPLFALVGEVQEVPSIEASTVRAHDAMVRAVADATDAVLPVQFGAALDDESEVAARLAPMSAQLLAALDQVAGCVQMIARLFLTDDANAAPAAGGPGTQYLRERARAVAVDEAKRLRAHLGALVVDEKVELHGAPPLAASVYHLVRRGDVEAWRAAVAAFSVPTVSVVVSGPYPAWAFAPAIDA